MHLGFGETGRGNRRRVRAIQKRMVEARKDRRKADATSDAVRDR